MKNLLFYYCLLLVILLTLGAAFSAQTASVIPLVLFLPITVYFLSLFLGKINGYRFSFPFQKPLSTLDLYYGFIVVAIMTISGLVGAKNISQMISGIIFLPLAGYFILQVLPKKRQAINIPAIILEPKKLKQLKRKVKHEDEPTKLPRIDVDRRQFLKLISAAGLSLFLFSIFAKKAQAAFFGSVPGPGTVALKDISGVQINPAQKQPTDGYKITQMDETSDAPNTYFGYLNKDGAWFIMKDDGSGNYRYKKGASGFTDADTGWPKRKDLTYGYFDAIFD
ncbi:MAG: hypothetical protein PHE48_04300 [Candidatus Daviesbacteria bacterium]|nr:hypothetical protein [Candidatus Daviesbacteria bacterium]